MIRTHILGFPRIGAQRELTIALERHWRGEIDAGALETIGRELRVRHWALQREAGLDFVTVGDFAYDDHVANHIQLFGCEPARFEFTAEQSALTRHFAMARGNSAADASASTCHGLERTQWFDTAYHYLRPEFSAQTRFRLAATRLLEEVAEAQALGHPVKPVLLGPLSFLWLGKSQETGFDRLTLLECLLPAYLELLSLLAVAGVPWIQIDEPILGLDLPGNWTLAFERTYHALRVADVPLMLSTYFSPLEDHLGWVCKLPVAGLHIDAVRAGHELQAVMDWLPPYRALSIGILDGRNIWRADLDRTLAVLRPALEKRCGHLWIAPSCSLLHVPVSLAGDPAIDPDLRGWLAGAQEKLAELRTLKRALSEGDRAVQDEQVSARQAAAARAGSPRVKNAAVRQRVAALPPHADRRGDSLPVRQATQGARLRLPARPVMPIDPLPQTEEMFAARAAFKRGDLPDADYRQAMAREIEEAVRKQETLGLDVLVHGEAARHDAIEYFGAQLEGVAVTANGWVQSHGACCVKPPVLFGDVSRPRPMTVAWTAHAQGLTHRPMKGLLTGPVTLLHRSFVRDDQSRVETALQIALALRD